MPTARAIRDTRGTWIFHTEIQGVEFNDAIESEFKPFACQQSSAAIG